MTNPFPELIEWPAESRIIKGRVRNPTLAFIKDLFNNIGVTSSIMYAILVMVIKPILRKQFLQRCDLSATTLITIRKLVVYLQRKISGTPIEILGFNERGNYIDHTTQTKEIENNGNDKSSSENKDSVWVGISDRLREVNDDLDTFNSVNMNRSKKNSENFMLNTKLLVQDIEYASNADDFSEQSEDLIKSIREIKGWFVSGKIR
ncbi:hypothetical protein C6P45_003389 [Maudiozyma exigua]|uniref:Pex17p n=1 Tax=Maudiozyma exigua TaxID=34358 RepID=A0A9P6WC48_MAUEX|nr:hypothetical protein C6P45_003389 [Kazachstania exigua]